MSLPKSMTHSEHWSDKEIHVKYLGEGKSVQTEDLIYILLTESGNEK